MRRSRDAPRGWPGIVVAGCAASRRRPGPQRPRPSARQHAPDRTRREGSCGSSESAWCRCAQSRPVTRSQAHRPGGPQVDAPRRGRRLGRSGAPRGEAAAATGMCEVLAQGHARASSQRTAGRGGSLKRLCLDAGPGLLLPPSSERRCPPPRTTALTRAGATPDDCKGDRVIVRGRGVARLLPSEGDRTHTRRRRHDRRLRSGLGLRALHGSVAASRWGSTTARFQRLRPTGTFDVGCRRTTQGLADTAKPRDRRRAGLARAGGPRPSLVPAGVRYLPQLARLLVRRRV